MEQDIANNIYELSSSFALRIVKLYKYLTEEKKEYVMSKQLLRSGTSIGANSFEGKNTHSRDDFAYKMSIALKEAGETGFWIDLLHRNGYLDDIQYNSIYNDCEELVKILVARCKKLDTELNTAK